VLRQTNVDGGTAATRVTSPASTACLLFGGSAIKESQKSDASFTTRRHLSKVLMRLWAVQRPALSKEFTPSVRCESIRAWCSRRFRDCFGTCVCCASESTGSPASIRSTTSFRKCVGCWRGMGPPFRATLPSLSQKRPTFLGATSVWLREVLGNTLVPGRTANGLKQLSLKAITSGIFCQFPASIPRASSSC